MTKERIDFDKEIDNLPWHHDGQVDEESVKEMAKSIAERVFDQAVKICESEWGILDEPEIENPYAQRSEPEKK